MKRLEIPLLSALICALLTGPALADSNLAIALPQPGSQSGPQPGPQSAGASLAHLALGLPLPAARWDDQPQSGDWTQTVLDAIATTAPDMATLQPQDIGDWCPAYLAAPNAQRRDFWVGLISALVHHESYYNPRNVSGGGQWFGLMQIFPPTARGYGCDARSGDALLDPQANLTCAVQIMAQSVADWPSISVNNGRWRGVAAQWGPMTQTRKRQDMQAWTNAQDYCQVSDRLALGPARLPLPALQ